MNNGISDASDLNEVIRHQRASATLGLCWVLKLLEPSELDGIVLALSTSSPNDIRSWVASIPRLTAEKNAVVRMKELPTSALIIGAFASTTQGSSYMVVRLANSLAMTALEAIVGSVSVPPDAKAAATKLIDTSSNSEEWLSAAWTLVNTLAAAGELPATAGGPIPLITAVP